MPRLFLSHAGSDADLARALARALRQAGLEVWLDVDDLKPGDRWMEAVEAALGRADAFAVLVGTTGVRAYVDRETRVALSRNTDDPSFRVIPVLAPGSDPGALPPFLGQHHWLDLRDGLDDPARVKDLVAAVLATEPATVSVLGPDEAPFLGLAAFHAENAHLFFGRDREVEDLLDKLRDAAFLAVVGDSGTGKSSLVRAGLVPALHRGRFGGAKGRSESWRIAVARPSDDPFRELASALPDLLPEASAADCASFRKECAGQIGDRGGLHNLVASIQPAGPRTLLVIDQFEELFTATLDVAVRRRFIEELLRAAGTEGDRPIHVVLTLRADFFAHVWKHPPLLERVKASQYLIEPLKPEQLREVVERPLALAGARFEPALVDAILDEAGDAAGTLPLLEHTLLRMWKLGDRKLLTYEDYKMIGRLSGALDAHAESVFRSFDRQPERQDLLRRMFLRLAQPGEATEAVRRRATRRELVSLAASPADGEAVLQRLIEERLVTARGGNGTPGGEAPRGGNGAQGAADQVEVAHEALLGGWKTLDGWLQLDREFLLWRKRLHMAMESGARLHGAALAEAKRWKKSRIADLSDAERGHIEEGLRAGRRRVAIGIAAILVLAFSGWGAFQVGSTISRWDRLRDNLRGKNYAAAFALLSEMRISGADVARLRSTFGDDLEEPVTFFEEGLAAAGAGPQSSAAVLAAVEALLPMHDAWAVDPTIVGTLAWALDYAPGRDRETAPRARSLREELLAAMRDRRRPPSVETLEWVDLPPGTFEMGSPDGVGFDDERPRHPVTVADFRMLAHEVTVGEYRRFAPDHDAEQADESLPAVGVSWYDAYAYAAWLGPDCRLPTEAEWEYAARRDCPYEYCDRNGNETTLDEVARYSGNSEGRIWPVKDREPGPTGLYDMYGNAWEWVADWSGDYDAEPQVDPWGPPGGNSRVLRGGSWGFSRNFARAACRDDFYPQNRNYHVGFRLLCSSPISVDF